MHYELTPIEQAFHDAAQGKIHGLECQQWVSRYRVDFVVRSHRLIIEVDGHEYHKTKEQRTADAGRQRFLQLEGWTVIRFTGTEIYNNASLCVDQTIDQLSLLPLVTTEEPPSDFICCVRIQEIVTHLFDKHGLELYENLSVTFTLGPHWLPLSIEKHGSIISISHYFEQNHDLVPDPAIEFYITKLFGDYPEWIPLSFQNIFDFRQGATVNDDDDNCFKVVDLEVQQDIAYFAEIWAKNIRQQGWIEGATVIDYNKWETSE
jgi:very-short-patch-repair endonuclease